MWIDCSSDKKCILINLCRDIGLTRIKIEARILLFSFINIESVLFTISSPFCTTVTVTLRKISLKKFENNTSQFPLVRLSGAKTKPGTEIIFLAFNRVRYAANNSRNYNITPWSISSLTMKFPRWYVLRVRCLMDFRRHSGSRGRVKRSLGIGKSWNDLSSTGTVKI